MSRLNTLAPDLRASLALLVGQHKRYGEIAALLGIDERAVHDRAHAALALLAPQQARALSATQRELLGEYLLGQADAAQQAAALALQESEPAARAWARALADELAPIAAGTLPEIPDAAGDAAAPADAQPAGAPGELVGSTGEHDDDAALAADGEPHEPAAPSSRRGGAVLLLGLAAVVIVAVALIVGLGGGNGSGGGNAPSGTAANASAGNATDGGAGADTQTTTSPTTAAGQGGQPATAGKGGSSDGKAQNSPAKGGSSGKGGASGQPRLTATVALTPPDTSSKALGLVEIIAEGHEHAFILAAEHLPPTRGFHYAAWLYNTPTDAYFLGGGTSVGASGTLKAAQGLPPDASRYASIILTEQHEEKPTQPGPIVLSGQLKLS